MLLDRPTRRTGGRQVQFVGKKKLKSNSAAKPASFEQALVEVEKIVFDLEEGKIGLADALERYEQGVELLKDCYQLLEKAESRIQQLSGVDADGNPITQTFDEQSEGSRGAKSSSPSKGRTSGKSGRPPRNDVDEGQGLF
jgi:exodeoxyribonuclease VII small subunit